MSPTVEQQLLALVTDTREDVAEIKGRMIALEAAQSKREALCAVMHHQVDVRFDALEDEQETTGLHERQKMQSEIDAYHASKTHWGRYLIGVIGTVVTGGVGALIAYALTHR
jgi:hypothetical protein